MGERDPRQECGCPSWVVQCVHLDGCNAIVIHHIADPPPCECYRATGFYYVLEIVDVRRCPCGDSPALVLNQNPTDSQFATIADARTEFDRRAELLRLGERHA